MHLTLPLPPSSNRYWRVWRGRMLLSAEAREYRRRVESIAVLARVKPFTGPVVVSVDVYRARKAGDLSNRIKILEDVLQGIAYVDDAQVVQIHARRFDDKDDPRVEVTVTEQET